MKLNNKKITIFGGTGFVGRYIVKELAKTGANLQILSRDPDAGLFLKTMGSVGQISLIRGSIFDEDLVEKLVADSDIIVNSVGILFEKKKNDFVDYHAKFPERLAVLAKKYELKQFTHISAIGVIKFQIQNMQLVNSKVKKLLKIILIIM